MPPSARAEAIVSEAGANDTALAVKNAVTLGGSLVATWGVALVVRFFLPRYLGPDQFGVLNFADSFAATSFIVLGLGLDTYIRKEIPVRPEHASDFFGGFFVVRLAMSALVFAGMAVFLAAAGRSPAVQRVAFAFGAAQILVVLNANLAALLHASRAVNGLALVNVISKVAWGAGVAIAIVSSAGLLGLAVAFLASEALRAGVLLRLTQRQIGLRFRFDPAAIKAVTIASFPFYVIQVAGTVYAKVDVTLLSLLTSDAEVGWYGTSSNLAGLAFLLSPLVSWVLMPLLSRAASRSREELFGILRRSIEAILLVVFPISLLLGVGADLWIPLIFGKAFAPAAASLRVLAPMIVFTYLATISATCLLLLGRAWTVALIQIGGLVLNPTLNLLFVSWAKRSLGPGGAGGAAAVALLLTEASVAIALTATVGRGAFDRASVRSLGKAASCCAAVVILDRLIAPLGPARLAIDALVYGVLLFVTGAIRPADVATLARFLIEKRRRHAST